MTRKPKPRLSDIVAVPVKNPHAVALGRLGGRAGTGASKSRPVTHAWARKAARARWRRARKRADPQPSLAG